MLIVLLGRDRCEYPLPRWYSDFDVMDTVKILSGMSLFLQ